jgi:type VI secretion system protein VasJ
LQWYIHQALVKSGQDVLADIIAADLKGLLRRLTGLETWPLMTVRRLPMRSR